MSRQLFAVCLLIFCTATLVAVAQNRGKKKPARRAKLPTFEHSLTSQFFFDDVFAKLNGPRPNRSSADLVTKSAGQTANPTSATKSHGWTKVISSDTIEDEVKAIKIRLDKGVTTPTDFAGRGFKIARRDFSVLAVMFAIVSEYDADVRWKNDAAAARDTFARVASNAKASGNLNVYKEAKTRLEELGDLLRGSRLNRQAENLENSWASITGRAPMMQRLESGFNQLAGWTGSETEFTKNTERVLHEAEMIAGISAVLVKDGMEDGDDEDYAALVQQMKKAALDISAAVKLNSADQARLSAGAMRKACAECHDTYR